MDQQANEAKKVSLDFMGFRLLRFTNTIILVCIAVLTITGVYGLFWTLSEWMFDLHRLTGWLLITCIPWKAAISLNSLKRGLKPDFDRGMVTILSILLGTVTLGVILLGVAWAWRLGSEQYWLGQTIISWHWLFGLGLLPFFALHAWRRWPRPRKADLISRHAAIKLLTLGGASLALWRVNLALSGILENPESPRRFTGSLRDGYFSGNHFPVTNNPGEGEEKIDPDGWQLQLKGAVSQSINLSYGELLSLPVEERVLSLDCTLGWYTTQSWRGVPLVEALKLCGVLSQAQGVSLESVTGYARFLPMAEAKDVLLATHVGHDPLEHWHGYPLRAVVPTRRGWYWVKWLSAIEILDLLPNAGDEPPHLHQSAGGANS